MHFPNRVCNEDGDCSVTSMNGHGQGSNLDTKKIPGLHDLGMLQKTFAPITTADLFKDPCYSNKPKSYFSIDRFLSREGRVRQPSSLKASAAEFGEGVISLSTGRPLPDTYPFERMEFAYSSPKSWNVQQINGCVGNGTRKAVVHRDDAAASIDLSIALSYGYNLGSEQLIQYLTTHVSHLHSPPYSDWEVCLTIGNTSALETAFRNFTDPGHFVLVEQYTYSGMIEAATALGLILVPVAMDVHGINPESMDRILSTWDDFHLGKPKPKVLYTIPTGHNPTGITQPRHRRLEILDIAEKHDILIIEDDPYYYLNFPQSPGVSNFLSLPSYLSLSTTGRVIRLDTTSKILAPGLRLGWLTAPKAIVETFQAAHDLGIVHPSGVSQLVVYKLLSETWGHDGFLQWLSGLASVYQGKAAAMLLAMKKELHRGILADICSWTDVQAGMFIWLKIDCSSLSAISRTLINTDARHQALLDTEHIIYAEALKDGVLCCKGSFFRAPTPACLRSDGHFLDALGNSWTTRMLQFSCA